MNFANQTTTTVLGSYIQTQKGYAFKSKWYSDHGKPIVKVSNLTESSVNVSNLTCIPNDIAASYSKYALTTDDIIIQTVGSWPSNPQSVVGKVVRVPSQASGALLNQNAVKVDPDSGLDRKFLFYLLKGKAFKQYIVACAQGAASQASITLEDIRKFRFALPPIPTQRKIASVLSAYDDLIENNNRRIEILEEMAQRIYREWFVHFRFPGHEKVGMVDSELGTVPEGWNVQHFSDLVDLYRSGINPSRFPEEEFAHFSIPAFDESKMPKREKGGSIRSNKHMVPEGCVLLSKINPRIPRVWLPFTQSDIRAITSTEFLILAPKSGATSVYLYGLCSSDEFSDAFAGRALGTSTSHQRVKPENLLSMPLVVPPHSWMQIYGKTTEPFLRAVHTLRKKNDNLRTTRNLLLPKLVSGEVSMEDLDVDPEEVSEAEFVK